MSRKIISTFTAAAMSMSIALAIPVAVTAVSSVTVVSEAQAGAWKNFKNSAKLTGKTLIGKRCKGGRLFRQGSLCGRHFDPMGRIGGGPAKRRPHDHRTK
jgi:hypothetical protein